MKDKTYAKKGKSIDEIISQMPSSPLDLLQVKLEPSRIGELLSIFENKYLPRDERALMLGNPERIPLGIILAPEEMPTLAKYLKGYESFPNFKAAAGKFLSVVLQESYDAGFNNFDLRVPFDVRGLADRIQGVSERPLILDIQNTGDYFGNNALYLIAKLQNPGSHCGEESYHCRFRVQGDAFIFCREASHMEATIEGRATVLGLNAIYSSFKCTKAIGIPGPFAKECEFAFETIEDFEFNDNIVVSKDPEHCLYTLQDQETAIKLAQRLPKGNKILCGNTVVRDYDD